MRNSISYGDYPWLAGFIAGTGGLDTSFNPDNIFPNPAQELSVRILSIMSIYFSY